MNDKARRVLEYNKIVGLLSDMASSSVTKERIGKLSPMTEPWKIREAQEETTEAVNVIMTKGALPLGGFYDIGGLARVAKKGGTLNMKQLQSIHRLLLKHSSRLNSHGGTTKAHSTHRIKTVLTSSMNFRAHRKNMTNS